MVTVDVNTIKKKKKKGLLILKDFTPFKGKNETDTKILELIGDSLEITDTFKLKAAHLTALRSDELRAPATAVKAE